MSVPVKALILDDNSNMRKLLKTILLGFDIRHTYEAGDAVNAFELMKEIRMDLAFVDYRLEDVDGIEFTRLVRTASDSPDPYLPIIMISAYSERGRVMDAVNAGVDEFLVKPVRAKDVASRIDAVMLNRRPFLRAPNFFGPDRRRRNDPTYKGPKRRATDLEETEFEIE